MITMNKRTKPLWEDNENLLGVLVAVFAVIITLVLFVLWRKRRSAGNNVLLMGLSGSGKTLIYGRLVHSSYVMTYTSVIENIGNIENMLADINSLRIVDIPGDERLRNKFFDKYKSSAKGLIYVIDSVTVQKEIRDVAEYLYNLLSDSDIQKNIPVLVLCNKQDQTMAKGCTVIKTMLEKEINLLQKIKTKYLEDIDASTTNVFLGKPGRDFEFSHLDAQIDFAESAAFRRDIITSPDLEELKKWLSKIA